MASQPNPSSNPTPIGLTWATALASLALLGGSAALRQLEQHLSQIGSASEELLRGQRLPVLKTTHKTHVAAQDSATLVE